MNSIEIVAQCPEVILPPIYSDESFEDRKSVFQAHLSPVNSKEEVQLVLKKLKENKKIANATHNMYAYR
jgi:putative IMPACT (imprinted ancient) family translation regulator